jgi:hypothetical protein
MDTRDSTALNSSAVMFRRACCRVVLGHLVSSHGRTKSNGFYYALITTVHNLLIAESNMHLIVRLCFGSDGKPGETKHDQWGFLNCLE